MHRQCVCFWSFESRKVILHGNFASLIALGLRGLLKTNVKAPWLANLYPEGRLEDAMLWILVLFYMGINRTVQLLRGAAPSTAVAAARFRLAIGL